MGARAKAVGVILGLVGLFAFASLAGSPKAKAAPRKKKEEAPEEVEVDEVEAEEEEVSVVLPGPNGEAEEGPEVAIDDELLEEDESWEIPANTPFRATVQPDGTPSALVAAIQNRVPGVTRVVIAGDMVEATGSAPSAFTLYPDTLRQKLKIPGTIVDIQLLPKEGEEGAPQPAPKKKPEKETAAEIVEEVVPEAEPEVSEAAKKAAKEVTGGQKPTPLIETETSKEVDPNGTNALARIMLARENLPGWKEDDLDGDISDWQEGVGETVDGKFGIDSAGRMAEEVGLLPLIRFYPKSVRTKAEGAKRYGRKIRAVIMKLQQAQPMSEAHIEALEASMAREKQQSMGTDNPPPQKTREWVAKVTEQIGNRAEDRAEKELEAS